MISKAEGRPTRETTMIPMPSIIMTDYASVERRVMAATVRQLFPNEQTAEYRVDWLYSSLQAISKIDKRTMYAFCYSNAKAEQDIKTYIACFLGKGYV